MNQIIANSGYKEETEYKAKKRRYRGNGGKINAILLIFSISLFLSYYIYAYYLEDKNMEEAENESILHGEKNNEEIDIEEETVMLGKLEGETIQEINVEYKEEKKSINTVSKTSENKILTPNTDSDFRIYEIDEKIYSRIKGKSYPLEGAAVSLEDLRYITVLHIGFDGKAHEGELIVNKSIANDIIDIFKSLYKAGYEIEKMQLIDEYSAIDEASMEDNNTSAFNNRKVGGTNKISKHAYGLAIDINPKQNPYVHSNGTCEPISGAAYADRTNKNLKHMINKDDLCYKLFIAHGFKWGGNFRGDKDYQHFYK